MKIERATITLRPNPILPSMAALLTESQMTCLPRTKSATKAHFPQTMVSKSAHIFQKDLFTLRGKQNEVLQANNYQPCATFLSNGVSRGPVLRTGQAPWFLPCDSWYHRHSSGRRGQRVSRTARGCSLAGMICGGECWVAKWRAEEATWALRARSGTHIRNDLILLTHWTAQQHHWWNCLMSKCCWLNVSHMP